MFLAPIVHALAKFSLCEITAAVMRRRKKKEKQGNKAKA